jgi:hypothetical protein
MKILCEAEQIGNQVTVRKFEMGERYIIDR